VLSFCKRTSSSQHPLPCVSFHEHALSAVESGPEAQVVQLEAARDELIRPENVDVLLAGIREIGHLVATPE
jgi:hypothetical protein